MRRCECPVSAQPGRTRNAGAQSCVLPGVHPRSRRRIIVFVALLGASVSTGCQRPRPVSTGPVLEASLTAQTSSLTVAATNEPATPAAVSASFTPSHCRQGDLELRTRFAPLPDLARGPLGGVLEMTNVSGRRCEVRADVHWWLGPDRNGYRAPGGAEPLVALGPGDTAMSALRTSTPRCDAGEAAPIERVRVYFPGGSMGASQDVTAAGLRKACAAETGQVAHGVWLTTITPDTRRYPRDVLSRLVPTIVELPAAGRPGERLDFVVRPTNVSDGPAIFDHSTQPGRIVECPQVSFAIGDVPPRTQLLPCDGARQISPGASGRYEFSVVVPDLQEELVTSLQWQFDELPAAATFVPFRVVL